ncbi:MAG: hypothetical protein ABI183_10950 [Polyangiaceae bacterium]
MKSSTKWIGLSFLVLAACGSNESPRDGQHESDPSSSGEVTGTAAQALTAVTRSDVVAQAELWAAAKLQYCQSPNGARDYDTACSTTCNRTSNAEWDPYRSDCSGLISWSWGLAAPGLVTSEFAPFGTTASKAIACTDLKPGDAANRNNVGHIVLFKGWISPGTKAVFIEEPGCSSSEPYAHDFTSDVTCNGNNIDIAYEADTFTAIRFDAIQDDPDAGAPSPDAGVTDVDASVVSSDPQAGDPDAGGGGGDAVDSDQNVPASSGGNSGGCAVTSSSARDASTNGFLFGLIALGLLVRLRRSR